MGKKFMGLDGTSHFWDRAKAWILEQVTSAGIDKQSVIDAVYPVGSLYWSGNSTDPSILFGGTWVQIKDRFVLACGDTYKTVGATGGASSVTLSVSNMPSHDHGFTPAGTVSAHSHGLNNHTHSFSGSHKHSHNAFVLTSNGGASYGGSIVADAGGNNKGTGYREISYTDERTVTISGTTGEASGNTTSEVPTFTGNAGTTESNGSGTSFSILPPYVVKYCWERTA